ncbi:isochorismatase family cysteine hydrolase [Leptolyngbya sp. FACHB-711]|uniref:cysteine hydrolase family protein n=1 Tax=unclassified Leptolyngbya TaxID=2650499 RepID=UPI0016879929|nr:isochorismatase family cysteine hydrolase [Leptolyngbya sp. FACHB-711]MBD2028309.1 isochorismatase family protein [Leptolyngbya sp. FACHB-711]
MVAEVNQIYPMGAAKGQEWLVSRDEVDMSRVPRPIRSMRVDADPQRVVVDASKSALLIVDMQNDFCTKGGWLDVIGVDYTRDRAPIAPLQSLVPEFRAKQIPIIWLSWGVRPDLLNIAPSVLHAHSPTGERVGLNQFTPEKRSHVLRKGDWGAAIVDELNPGDQDIHVTKHRFSGFWDTELDSILRNMGIATLFVGGVNMDQCVLSTLQDATFLGYDCILIEDCTATTSPQCCIESTLYNVKLLYGFITQSKHLLAGLAQL